MKTHSSVHRSKRKTILLPLLLAIPLLGGLTLIAFSSSPEALSPEEIISKQEWSDEELQHALSHTISPTMDSHRKKDVMQHLSNQLQKRSPADQDRIRQGAVIEVVDSSLKQIRKMPSAERQRVLKTMQQKAESSYDAILHDQRVRNETFMQMQSKEFEVFAKEVDRVIFSELTPEEKVQFAPLTRVWMRTMKTMGR